MASTNTAVPSTVERLEVTEVEEGGHRPQPKVIPMPTPRNEIPAPAIAPVPVQDLAILRSIAAVIAASAAVLATRLILLLALIGGFVLAVMAIQSPNAMVIGVLIAYGVLIMIPLVYLETRTRWHGGG